MLHYLGHNSAKQIPQVNFSPQRGSQQGEEPGKRMTPCVVGGLYELATGGVEVLT
jgi:hypothetical protein